MYSKKKVDWMAAVVQSLKGDAPDPTGRPRYCAAPAALSTVTLCTACDSADCGSCLKCRPGDKRRTYGKEFLPYDEARGVVRCLKLRSQSKWQAWSKSKRPTNIPSHPNDYYRDSGWISLPDWLGNGRSGRVKRARLF